MKKRVKSRSRTCHNVLTENVYCQLTWTVLDGMKPLTRKQSEQLWNNHREEICGQFCEQNPGMMPSAWWVFDAGQGYCEDGWFAFRHGGEKESQTIARLDLLDSVIKLGYIPEE